MSQSTTIASAVAHVGKGAIDRGRDAVAAHFAHGDDQIARGERVLMHRPGVGEASEPHLGNVGSRKPILNQRPDRVAVAEPFACAAHVEMGVECDQSNPFER